MARLTPTKRRAEFYAEKVVKNGTKPTTKSKSPTKSRNRSSGKSDMVYS